jgi:hypothetical protein
MSPSQQSRKPSDTSRGAAEQRAGIQPPSPASVARWFFPDGRDDGRRQELEEAITELMTQAAEQALANYRAAREALALVRQTVEELAPPGTVTNNEQIGPDPIEEAEALIRGIEAIAAQNRRGFV